MCLWPEWNNIIVNWCLTFKIAIDSLVFVTAWFRKQDYQMMHQSAVIIYYHKQKWKQYISVKPQATMFIWWHTYNSLNYLYNVPCRNSQFMTHPFIKGWWRNKCSWHMGLLCMLEANGKLFTYSVSLLSPWKGLAPSLLLVNSTGQKPEDTLMRVFIYQCDSSETAALHKSP